MRGLLFLFSISVYSFASAADFGFTELKNLIQSNQITTVEKILPKLPEDLRAKYTLMFESRGMQEASIQNPRAILFGKDAKLILAFNGSSDQKGYNTIEAIEFNSTEKKFEFYHVVFPKAGSNDPTHFSMKNPPHCMHCHGKDLRPNWEGYKNWPGAFAGNDDRPRLDPDRGNALQEFISKANQHPRYQWLIDLKKGYEISQRQSRTPGRHNSVFTQSVSQLNFQRLAQKITNHPQYEKIKYALLGSFWCEVPFRDFFPKDQQAAIPSNLFGRAEQINVATLQYLFPNESILANWSMTFFGDTTGASFITPGGAAEEFSGHIVSLDKNGLREFFDFHHRSHLGMSRPMARIITERTGKECEDLTLKSRIALSSTIHFDQ